MDETRLKEIEEREKRTAAGLWKIEKTGYGHIHIVQETFGWIGKSAMFIADVHIRIQDEIGNAEFIAHSRQDIPDLIDEVRNLQQQLNVAIKEIEKLRAELAEIQNVDRKDAMLALSLYEENKKMRLALFKIRNLANTESISDPETWRNQQIISIQWAIIEILG